MVPPLEILKVDRFGLLVEPGGSGNGALTPGGEASAGHIVLDDGTADIQS